MVFDTHSRGGSGALRTFTTIPTLGDTALGSGSGPLGAAILAAWGLIISVAVILEAGLSVQVPSLTASLGLTTRFDAHPGDHLTPGAAALGASISRRLRIVVTTASATASQTHSGASLSTLPTIATLR